MAPHKQGRVKMNNKAACPREVWDRPLKEEQLRSYDYRTILLAMWFENRIA
jgi:hypothetical protein